MMNIPGEYFFDEILCIGGGEMWKSTKECRSQGGRKPIASCQREIWSRHFLWKLFEKNFSIETYF